VPGNYDGGECQRLKGPIGLIDFIPGNPGALADVPNLGWSGVRGRSACCLPVGARAGMVRCGPMVIGTSSASDSATDSATDIARVLVRTC